MIFPPKNHLSHSFQVNPKKDILCSIHIPWMYYYSPMISIYIILFQQRRHEAQTSPMRVPWKARFSETSGFSWLTRQKWNSSIENLSRISNFYSIPSAPINYPLRRCQQTQKQNPKYSLRRCLELFWCINYDINWMVYDTFFITVLLRLTNKHPDGFFATLKIINPRR